MTLSIIKEFQESQGWSDSTVLGLLIDYLDAQQADDAVREHFQLHAEPDAVTLKCCANCGSTTNLRKNADLTQNHSTGEWEIAEEFDCYECVDCGEEVRVNDKEVAVSDV